VRTAVRPSQSAFNPTLNKEAAFSSDISTSDMASLRNIHSTHPAQRNLKGNDLSLIGPNEPQNQRHVCLQ